MQSLFRPRLIAAAGLGCALLAVGSAAQAHVWFSLNVPLDPAPVYVQPQPVYVDPQPAVVAPGPVYAVPQVPAWQREEWQRQEWRRRYWEHRRWEHWRWERRHHRGWDDDDD